MKKILFLVVPFLFLSSIVHASVFVDASSFHSTSRNAPKQSGVALDFGAPINNDVDAVFKAAYTFAVDNEGYPNEISYEFLYVFIGGEYSPHFKILERYRLSWKNGIYMGLLRSYSENKLLSKENFENNLDYAFYTGLQFDANQHFAPFLNIGFHFASDKRDFFDVQERGFQAELGLRFYFFGSRDSTSGY